jgi:hypothetical protein
MSLANMKVPPVVTPVSRAPVAPVAPELYRKNIDEVLMFISERVDRIRHLRIQVKELQSKLGTPQESPQDMSEVRHLGHEVKHQLLQLRAEIQAISPENLGS